MSTINEEMIPYKIESREDTGLYNARFGIWLFLASEIMLFGALFSSYVLLRVGVVSWPHQAELLNVPLGALNSVVLITSSMFIIQAWLSLKNNNLGRYKKFMWLTVVFAFIFLVFKGFEYTQHFVHNEFPRTSIFMALYYLMTGVHALHIIGGILVNMYYVGPGSRLWNISPQWLTNRVEVAGLYWHFVDIVWIFLFSTLYLL